MTKKDENQSPLEQKILELEAQLEQAHEELSAAQEGQVRALADLENFRRRQATEQAGWTNRAVSHFLTKILPNMLELSLGAAHSTDEVAKTTIEKFFSDMEKHGLTKIEPAPGDDLDANLHEVLMAEDGESGKVVRCLEIGWKFNDTVIAPAKVSAAPL